MSQLFLKRITNDPSLLTILLFAAAFILWIICFWGFLVSHLMLTSDASAYIEHVHLFVSSIIKGIYPLWDPDQQMGMPTEFFLRRIGSFNPIFLVVLALCFLGLPFYLAYLFFLAIYYFIGVIGFYLLSLKVFSNNRTVALFSAFTLLFSSWSTRLFDSYIYLTLIPLIWFFYFLIAFLQNPSRKSLLGISLCLMILMTTYIPYYFVNIFLTFTILGAAFFYKDLLQSWQRVRAFVASSKFVTIFCVMAVLASLIPGILFFKEAKDGNLVLSERSVFVEKPAETGGQAPANAFLVDLKTITSWGIEEDLMYSWEYRDTPRFKFAVVYLPFFACCIALLGMAFGVSRKTFFFFTWGIILFLLMAHRASIYGWLYQHVSYFKYFRNLHFYLWFALIPICILWIASLLEAVLKFIPANPKERKLYIIYVSVVHLACIWFLSAFIFGGITAYIVVVLSWIFFILYGLNSWKNTPWVIVAIAVLCVLQPMEIYHALKQNSFKTERVKNFVFNLKLFNNKKSIRFLTPNELIELDHETKDLSRKPSMYYSLLGHSLLVDNLYFGTYVRYLNNPFYAYSQVKPMPMAKLDFKEVEDVFKRRLDVAFVEQEEAGDQVVKGPLDSLGQVNIILKDSKDVEVIKRSYNHIKIKTRFKQRQFLVYNDGYDKGWFASIDGKPLVVRRANVAFKGVWVPAGEHVITFHYAPWWRYALNISLMILFYGMAFAIIRLAIRNKD